MSDERDHMETGGLAHLVMEVEEHLDRAGDGLPAPVILGQGDYQREYTPTQWHRDVVCAALGAVGVLLGWLLLMAAPWFVACAGGQRM